MRKHRMFRLLIPLALLSAVAIAWAVLGTAGSDNAVWPEAAGEAGQKDGKLVIDYSHMDQGYVMARVKEQTGHTMKLRVTYNGGQLMYDINNNGNYEAYPLQLGSGTYEFALFENVKGSKFSAEGKITFNAQLRDENAAFLVPNQYVSYNRNSATVLKSDEICAGKSQKESFDAICNFMASEFTYDFVRAKTISSGTMPEVDPCFEKRSGICQDLAAVMVCMCRVQGIPAKLVIGYADKYYHAWTLCVVDGKEVFFDPTEAIGAINASSHSIERVY